MLNVQKVFKLQNNSSNSSNLENNKIKIFFRTFTVAIVMMVGRIGALGGNVLFPVLLQSGCLFPFAGVTGTLLRKSTQYNNYNI